MKRNGNEQPKGCRMSASVQTVARRQRARQVLSGKIGDRSARCGVIGLGFIGSVLMDALIASGFAVVGYDRSASAVVQFKNYIAASPDSSARSIEITSAKEALAVCDVVFLAVRNPVENGVVDDEPLQAAASLLKGLTARPRLVLLESTVMPGTTRRLDIEFGRECQDFVFLVNSPERLSAGQDHTHLRSIPHLVGGSDQAATALGVAMLETICDRVVSVSSPEVSELSKLLENAFLSVNIGLIAEITGLAMKLGIRATDVCDAAATKSGGFMPFHPGAGLGGHCLPNDLELLSESARISGLTPWLLSGAITANKRAPNLVVERLEELMNARGTQLPGSSVVLVGVGFKTGSADTTRSPACDITRQLINHGASVSYVDSQVESFFVDGVEVQRVSIEVLHKIVFEGAIILSGDAKLPYEALLASAGIVLDAGGSRKNGSAQPKIESL
jgi:UDP-N-acetyl-D-glucosamine dehydrogenase